MALVFGWGCFEMDINQNLAKCIEHTNDFGQTVVHNICNGTTQVVPWGSMDWVGVIGISAFGVVIVAMLGGMAYRIITDF